MINCRLVTLMCSISLHYLFNNFNHGPLPLLVLPYTKAALADALYEERCETDIVYMQTPVEINSSPSSDLQRWHPKLTPYRLLVLGATIGIGTARAIAVQEGHTGVPGYMVS